MTDRAMRIRWRMVAALAVTVALVVPLGCGDDGDGGDGDSAGAPTSQPSAGGGSVETAAPEDDTITVLVTNDDGVGAEGIDAVATALDGLEGVEVVVVAPAENQSGSGDATTPGTVPRSDATTLSGLPAVAVAGKPGDSVVVALDELGIEPDLVVSGSNLGQNIGPSLAISGTVGAAKVAARRGVPAVAVSQGLGDPFDFPVGVGALLEWFEEHRDEIEAGTLGTDEVTSINAPSCATGEVRGTVTVPNAPVPDGRDLSTSDCTSTATDPVDDVAAFTTGWITVTIVPVG